MDGLLAAVSALANVATILTAGIALWALVVFQRERWGHRRQVEAFLFKHQKGSQGLYSSEIAPPLRMTIEEVERAALSSKKIVTWTTKPMVGAPPMFVMRHRDRPKPD